MLGEKKQDNWVDIARKEKHSLFSELDVLLRALEKFFIVEYLPLSETQFSTKNFYPELNASKSIIQKILEVLDDIIPEEKKNAFRLKRFAESRYLSGRGRELFREALYRQDTQEKSLFLLYDSLINLKTIVNDLLRNANIQFMSFRNIGQIIGKEIRENVFFNPFKKSVDPEFDHIENREIADIIRNIKNKDIKRIVSIIMLHLFRILRFLRYIDRSTDQPIMHLHTSVATLTLLRSEIDFLRSYAEKQLVHIKDNDISMLLQALSYQFKMESRRIFMQELRDILDKKLPHQMQGRIENSHGILNNLIEQSVIQIAQFWKPEIKGEEVFEDFVNKTELSMKLREDMYVLNQLLNYVEESKKTDKAESSINSLLGYMEYFESFTFKLLRHDDYEEFSTIFIDIKKVYNASDIKTFMDKCHQLSILLSAAIGHIENRSELKDKPLDVEKAQSTVKQYVSGS
jgi:hypothetical protein